MISIGSVIKMTKNIANFNMVGEKFSVTAIAEDGTITFSAPFGVGLMSPKELNEHFETVEEAVAPKFVWTKWIDEEDGKFGHFAYKTNNKKVKVKWGGCVCGATCHPTDKFDYKVGCRIALARCYLKFVLRDYYAKEVNE